jgi:hypothetical protein
LRKRRVLTPFVLAGQGASKASPLPDLDGEWRFSTASESDWRVRGSFRSTHTSETVPVVSIKELQSLRRVREPDWTRPFKWAYAYGKTLYTLVSTRSLSAWVGSCIYEGRKLDGLKDPESGTYLKDFYGNTSADVVLDAFLKEAGLTGQESWLEDCGFAFPETMSSKQHPCPRTSSHPRVSSCQFYPTKHQVLTSLVSERRYLWLKGSFGRVYRGPVRRLSRAEREGDWQLRFKTSVVVGGLSTLWTFGKSESKRLKYLAELGKSFKTKFTWSLRDVAKYVVHRASRTVQRFLSTHLETAFFVAGKRWERVESLLDHTGRDYEAFRFLKRYGTLHSLRHDRRIQVARVRDEKEYPLPPGVVRRKL